MNPGRSRGDIIIASGGEAGGHTGEIIHGADPSLQRLARFGDDTHGSQLAHRQPARKMDAAWQWGGAGLVRFGPG